MRNIHIDALDHAAREIVAIGTDYPHGKVLPWHSHRRVQLLYGSTGVMHVFTRAGNWVVPPQRAVWIPAMHEHKVQMIGVSTCSLYIEPRAIAAGRSECQVIEVSPLLRELLKEAVDMPLHYDTQGRDGTLAALLLHEVAGLPALPFHIPLPRDTRLAAECRAFLAAPDIHQPSRGWAERLHMSARTFSRRFRKATGMSFLQWKQQACVVLALARLAKGEPITRIAIEFGYESPAAFSAMFRRVLGQPPSDYLPSGPPRISPPGRMSGSHALAALD